MNNTIRTIVAMFEDDTHTACRIGQDFHYPCIQEQKSILSTRLPTVQDDDWATRVGYIVSGTNPITLFERSLRRVIMVDWLLEEPFGELGVAGLRVGSWFEGKARRRVLKD